MHIVQKSMDISTYLRRKATFMMYNCIAISAFSAADSE